MTAKRKQHKAPKVSTPSLHSSIERTLCFHFVQSFTPSVFVSCRFLSVPCFTFRSLCSLHSKHSTFRFGGSRREKRYIKAVARLVRFRCFCYSFFPRFNRFGTSKFPSPITQKKIFCDISPPFVRFSARRGRRGFQGSLRDPSYRRICSFATLALIICVIGDSFWRWRLFLFCASRSPPHRNRHLRGSFFCGGTQRKNTFLFYFYTPLTPLGVWSSGCAPSGDGVLSLRYSTPRNPSF